MAMEPPDVVLSPEPGQDAAGSRSTITGSSAAPSSGAAAALLQLQPRAHAQTPPAAFHLAAAQKLSVALPAGSSRALQPAQLTSIAVPTALLASTGQHQHQQQQGGSGSSSTTTSLTTSTQPTPPIERLSRPMAFDKVGHYSATYSLFQNWTNARRDDDCIERKMESLVREMQDPENGVPVRSQKLFLTSIPSAFMGYDLIEWLMERLTIEESEALNISNQLCQHGYFFPVSDSKTLMVKDDSSLYRFQTPYYWPWQQKAPDQIEYAIYLAKRSLRNKQRHGLEDYETEALASLHKNLKGKWDFIMLQAEEQVRLAKERKKGDKIVGDSQERAYWRVHRPPPGQFTPLEPCPIPSRDRQGRPRKRTVEDWQREVDILKASLGRNRVRMSQACESLASYYETFSEYDPMMQPPLPSNPWVTEDVSFWQLNSPVVEVPTEKRVKRWGISIEEVVSDPTGLQEFTHYLKKEYSHENIRFWMAVNDLRRSSHSQIPRKVTEIYEEFLEPGAPCEINIDGKTMEKVQQGLKNPSRFAFDSAAEHIYMLLLKKDCYPRFVRSEHYKSLMANAIQPSHKKRFFGFGGGAKKKGSTSTAPNPSLLTQLSTGQSGTGNVNSLSKRRGSDRSLSGSAHELAISGVKDCTKVPHSHSQSNLSDIPYSVSIYRGDMPSGVYEGAAASAVRAPARGNERVRKQEVSKALGTTLEVTLEGAVSGGGAACSVCPWETMVPDKPAAAESAVSVSVCPWDESDLKPPAKSENASTGGSSSSSSKLKPFGESTHGTVAEMSEVSERMKRSCGLRQNTLDSDFHSTKRLAPVVTEQRRASMTMAPRLSDLQFCLRANSTGDGATPPDLVSGSLSASVGHPHHTVSSARASQGSLSTSFEEKEELAGVVAPHLDSGQERQQPEQGQGRYRQASEEDWRPAVLGASGYADATRMGAPQSVTSTLQYTTHTTDTASGCIPATRHTQSSEDVRPAEVGPAGTSSAINTSMTTVGTTAVGAVGRHRDTREGAGPDGLDSATGTPRISVIYANSLERDDGEGGVEERELRDERKSAPEEQKQQQQQEQQQEQEERRREGIVGSCAAASVATQTMDVGASVGVGPDLSPLNEVEDHFFGEAALRPQDQPEYDAISDGGDGLLPGYVAPAPTPAPSIAPLAEVELDPPDDEPIPDEDEDEAEAEAVVDDEHEEEQEEEQEREEEEEEAGEDEEEQHEDGRREREQKKKKEEEEDEEEEEEEEEEEGMERVDPCASVLPRTTVVIVDDPGKRRRRKERKDRPPELEQTRAQKSEEENTERKGNAVCPWDDEDESAVDDAPYVKTYSTLGYL